MEETNRAYEEKIRNLEKLLQTTYSKSIPGPSVIEQGHVESLEKKISILEDLLAKEKEKNNVSMSSIQQIDTLKDMESSQNKTKTLENEQLHLLKENQELKSENVKVFPFLKRFLRILIQK